MGKEDLRKGMLLSLEKIGWLERNRTGNDLHDHLFESDLWKNADSIGVTVSSGREWDTRTIIERAWDEGKTVCVPKSIHETKDLHFYEISSFRQLEKGYFGLEEPLPEKTTRREPEDLDLMIVPGLIFTPAGYRIGYGGGYFDRLLAGFNKPTVSLLHSNQIVESFPIEAHDVPVDFLITEQGLKKTGLDQ